MVNPSRYDYDVIIIGGGPAGCATALSIAKCCSTANDRVRVLLVDNADPHAYKIGESLPAAAKRLLSMLDPLLLASLASDTAQGLHDICTGNASAWASSELHETYALMNPYGAGWHLDRAHFDEALRQACGAVLQKGKFVAVRRVHPPEESAPDSVDAAGCRTSGWDVDVELSASGRVETFRTRWLVDATGRKASVAHKIGVKTRRHSDILAFYLVFDRIDSSAASSGYAEDRDTRTLIEAVPSGWWYSARLPHGKRLVMYTISPSDATARVARSASGFLDMLHSDTVHIARALYGASLGERNPALDGLMPVYELPPGTKTTHCTTACSSVLEPYGSWAGLLPFGHDPSAEEHTDSYSDAQRGGRGWCAVGDAALAFDPLSISKTRTVW